MLLKAVSFLSILLIALTTVMAANDRGNYTIPGYGRKKQGILNNGGGTLEIAIAMLETDNTCSDYVYGDNKTGDSANFGIFKQGWFMLRSSTSQFRGKSDKDWNEGAALNWNLRDDIKARQESHRHYGTDRWFGGHRNGETGLNQPYTQDISNYKNAIYWIQRRIQSDKKFLSDDTRFWVQVNPI
ncbi:hypothetical protein BC941DRAFT_463654 [Chlamydoabsidia padenii]|nr:hypothetical protein BC941DRAFT_463654 [Chlamydoabsidia padenii]